MHQSSVKLSVLNDSINDGLWFLRKKQRPDGSFAVYYSLDHTFERNCTDDQTPFASAMVAHCLKYVGGGDAQAVIDKSVSLFLNEMRFGVWRYWLRAHPRYKNIPPDVDTTSCVSIVLKSHGVSFPDNRAVLLLNRDASGLFYTWIKPRLRLTSNVNYIGIIIEQLIKPVRSFLYWRVFNCRPNDIDALINANVLLYLGLDDDTLLIADSLCSYLENLEEEVCDKWYRNALLFYYFASRSLAPLFDMRVGVRAKIVERTIGRLKDDRLPINLAFGISALIECGAFCPELTEAVTFLLGLQDRDGSWEACPMYYDGPAKIGAFGSEELTTGFCLEALGRFRSAVYRDRPEATL